MNNKYFNNHLMYKLKITLIFHVLILISTSPVIAQQEKNQGNEANRNIYFIPFSHLDLMWAGTREECLSRSNRIIASAIELGRRQPEFHFLIEDMVFADNFIKSHPGSGDVKYLKQFVKEGRFEVSPKWAGIFQNLPPGEVHARNYLYGKLYANQVFKVNPLVSQQGDIPGFTPQYPQIMAKAGVPYMIMTRMGPANISLFNWAAPDGSKVLVWDTKKGYGWGVSLGLHNSPLTDEAKKRIRKEVNEIRMTTSGPLYMGWGTDLWSPNENLIENVKLLNKEEPDFKFIPSTPLEYFENAVKTPGLQVIAGEIPNSWPSVSSSFPHMWKLGVSATSTLLSAEKLAAVNYALGYADYPEEEFGYLWKKLIESMDHNHDGQGGLTGNIRKIEYSSLSLIRGGDILRDMARNIAEKVNIPFKRSFPIVVINVNGWDRNDIVSAHVSIYGDVGPYQIDDFKKGLKLIDEKGTRIPFHVIQYTDVISRSYDLIFVAEKVPALGYKTYYLQSDEKTEEFSMSATITLDSDLDKRNPSRPLGMQKIENEFYTITVDRATGRVSVFDKDLNRLICRDMEIVALEERGGNNPNPEELTGRTFYNSIDHTGIEESNSVRTVFRIEGSVAGIPLVQRLVLYRNLKRLDIENNIKWTYRKYIRLEQLFPFEEDEEVVYGVPFGASSPNNIMPGAGPRARDEIQKDAWVKYREIQDWIWVGTKNYGFTVAIDHNLLRFDNCIIRSQMLRGLRWTSGRITRDGITTTNQYPPEGNYTFRYSFTSGRGDWKENDSYKTGIDFNTPLIPVAVADEISEKSLPPSASFLRLSSDDLVLSAVKKAENDPGLVVRFFDIKGSGGKTQVLWMDKIQNFREVNLIEEKPAPKDQILLKVDPFEIKSVKLHIK